MFKGSYIYIYIRMYTQTWFFILEISERMLQNSSVSDSEMSSFNFQFNNFHSKHDKRPFKFQSVKRLFDSIYGLIYSPITLNIAIVQCTHFHFTRIPIPHFDLNSFTRKSSAFKRDYLISAFRRLIPSALIILLVVHIYGAGCPMKHDRRITT